MESPKRNFSRAIFQIEEDRDIFEELFSWQYYDGLIIALYCLGLLSCVGLILVSWFEKSGQAGPYRSLINQLISQRLDQMVLLYVFGLGISANRLIYGALPIGVCKVSSFVQMFTILNICHLTILISGTRFAFVFIFKQVPTMDDKFLSCFLMILVNGWSFLTAMTKFYIDEKVFMTERLCTGTWPEETAKEPFPIVALVCCYTLPIYVGVNLAIKFKKGQLQMANTANHYNNGHVMELFDVVSTFLSTSILAFIVISFTFQSKVTQPEELLKYPNNVLVRISGIPSMFCFVTIQAISHFWKNLHIRKACWRLLFPVRVTPIV